jgi:hypothetical protein
MSDIVNRMTRRLRRQATLRTLAFVTRDAKTSASLYFSPDIYRSAPMPARRRGYR